MSKFAWGNVHVSQKVV